MRDPCASGRGSGVLPHRVLSSRQVQACRAPDAAGEARDGYETLRSALGKCLQKCSQAAAFAAAFREAARSISQSSERQCSPSQDIVVFYAAVLLPSSLAGLRSSGFLDLPSADPRSRGLLFP